MVGEGVSDKVACRAGKEVRRMCALWYTSAKSPDRSHYGELTNCELGDVDRKVADLLIN